MLVLQGLWALLLSAHGISLVWSVLGMKAPMPCANSLSLKDRVPLSEQAWVAQED